MGSGPSTSSVALKPAESLEWRDYTAIGSSGNSLKYQYVEFSEPGHAIREPGAAVENLLLQREALGKSPQVLVCCICVRICLREYYIH